MNNQQQQHAGGGGAAGGPVDVGEKEAEQQAATFISDILQEVHEHDRQSALAADSYFGRLRFWQRGSGNNNKSASVSASAAADATDSSSSSSNKSLDDVHQQLEQKRRDGSVVQRTRAAAGDAAAKDNTPSSSSSSSSATARSGSAASSASAAASSAASKLRGYNPLLFRKMNPEYVPLVQRWWVPYVGVAFLGLVWTPDMWKLRTLYYLDHQYALLRQSVHLWYWWMTMDPESYKTLESQVLADVPKEKQISSTKCPI